MSRQQKQAKVLLTADQELEAERIYGLIKAKVDEQVREMARLMASKKTCEILGPGEFQLRDRLNEFGAGVVEAALNERVKKGRLSGS
jgi:nucleoid DNA-binding protein